MGTRILREFEYLKPQSINEAILLLERYGDKARILAGGTDLLISMKRLLIKPKYLIDISAVEELRNITFDDKRGLIIGAATVLGELQGLSLIKERYTALFEAICKMATTQVRNIATIGGNICNASPAADTVPPLLVLDAKVDIATQSGTRTVPLEEFFLDPGKTVLKSGEFLKDIIVPTPVDYTQTCFSKISRTSSDLAIVNAAIALQINNGICKDAKIALGSVAPIPIRVKKAEDILRNNEINENIIMKSGDIVAEEISPITDIRSTSDYRKDVASVIVKRALMSVYNKSVGKG